MPFEFKPCIADPELKALGIHSDEYRYDFEKISADLCRLREKEQWKDVYSIIRAIAPDDLFFLLYFVLDIAEVNDPFVLARIYEFQSKHDMTLDLWPRGHFKAIDINEPVLTTDGWKNHGDLVPGDMVYAGDGFPVMVTGKTDVFTNADCYRVTFDDGYSVVASGDHLWTVERRTTKRDFYKRKYRETVTISTREIFYHGCRQDNRMSVWVVPVEFPEREYPIDPYILGAWLGDGSSADGRITCGDEDVFTEIKKRGYSIGRGSPGKEITRTIYGIRPDLRKLCVLENKHIPETYKYGSIDQRVSLLQGLMDTDGTVDKRGTATFVNINERLAKDVYEVCTTLGLKPMIRTHYSIINNEKYKFFQVSFQAYKDSNIFKIKRKVSRCFDGKRKTRKFITNIEKVESIPVSCIQVDGDGTYLIGKNLTVTHNSTIITFGSPIQKLLNNSLKRICIFSMTRALAIGHMRRIKTTLETNELLINSFPEIFYNNPITQSLKWSEEMGLIVRRKKIYTEASIEAWGLDNLPTGKHFTDIHFDDILDARNVNTQAQIDKTTYNLGLAMQLVHKKYEMCAAGTFYSLKDTYHAMIKSKLWFPRLYPAEVDEKGGWKLDGTPVMMDAEELKRRRSDIYVYFCQMLLHPVPLSDQKFNRNWIKFWTPKTKRPPMNIYILVDSAKKTDKKHDYTVMMVVGVDSRRCYWLLDMVRDKIDVYKRWEKLADLVKSWGVTEVGYEQYAAMVDTEVMRRQMMEDGLYFNIIELGGQVSKDDRIKKLVPDFQRGRWIIPDCLSYRDSNGEVRDLIVDYIEEYENWVPGRNVGHDDMLDCQARIYESKMNVTFPTERGEPQEETQTPDPLNLRNPQVRGTWMSVG